jgi:hypothetical protein
MWILRACKQMKQITYSIHNRNLYWVAMATCMHAPCTMLRSSIQTLCRTACLRAQMRTHVHITLQIQEQMSDNRMTLPSTGLLQRKQYLLPNESVAKYALAVGENQSKLRSEEHGQKKMLTVIATSLARSQGQHVQ